MRLALVVLVLSASCAHPHEPGTIDTPISSWHSWSDTCRIHKACKPVKPLPRCSPGLLASAAHRAFSASKDSKDVRSVVGTLQSGYEATPEGSGHTSCTKMACCAEGEPKRQCCCNTCERHVLLLGEDGSVVGLTGNECVGDESRLCCSIDVQSQKVIATGVLEGYEQGKVWFRGKYDVCVP